MIDEVFGRAFSMALVVAIGVMVVYQIVMLIWTKKTAGVVPTPIKVLRGINIAVLLAISVLVVLQMVGD
jgi:hypothetical protein